MGKRSLVHKKLQHVQRQRVDTERGGEQKRREL